MRSGQARLVVAGAVAVLGIVLAVVVVMRYRTSPAFVPSSSGSKTGSSSSVSYNIVPTAETVETAAVEVADAAAEHLRRARGQLDEAGVESFRDEAAQVLGVYLAGSPEAFESYLRSHDMALPNGWGGPTPPREFWEYKLATLRLANLSTEGVAVRARFLGGREVAQSDPSPVDMTERPERAPWASDPAGQRLDVYELLVPCRFPTHEGESFDGRLGLWLARRPGGGEWTLVRICVYNRPNEAGVVMPPI